jgi:hypothetical protein
MFNYLTPPLKGYDFGTSTTPMVSPQKELDRGKSWVFAGLMRGGDTVERPAIPGLLRASRKDDDPSGFWGGLHRRALQRNRFSTNCTNHVYPLHSLVPRGRAGISLGASIRCSGCACVTRENHIGNTYLGGDTESFVSVSF